MKNDDGGEKYGIEDDHDNGEKGDGCYDGDDNNNIASLFKGHTIVDYQWFTTQIS